ncbi:Mitogen-activated protein kinase kinase kinase 4 [Fasciola gigantica]|uniref:Mitogen-activated protein kinase kinase kinase 4 n=1 Tax=Fasciola gigantica TaxID=46835 RepID=A0A504YHC1_FASGI|nr:Mitogen-activated protein kinase kinase kinase 4 [Fasciola gigantica]
MAKDVHDFNPVVHDDESSFSGSENSDVSLKSEDDQVIKPLSNSHKTRNYQKISGCLNRLPNKKHLRNWHDSPLFADVATRWTDESDAAVEDSENRRPDSHDLGIITIPVNTSTPIMPETSMDAVESNNVPVVQERVVLVNRTQLDMAKALRAPVKSKEPTSQPQLRTAPSLILPSDDDEQPPATEIPIDPYKRARKFLYRLAPLLKLSLPSRVERKRSASVMDFSAQTGCAPNFPDTSCSSRTSPWIRQWIKHGQHCITFSGGEVLDLDNKSANGQPPGTAQQGVGSGQPAAPPWNSGPHLALSKADLYVQHLWRELQLRLHGPLFMEELHKRRAFANTVMQRIVSFSMQPNEMPATGSSETDCLQSDVAIEGIQDSEADGCFVSPNYLTLLVAASKSVSQLLQQTDRVEQAWSSDARLVREFSDWALPEVRCRLVCLRQWSGTLASLQRGVHQLCEFLHCPTSIQCATHVTSVRQTAAVSCSERDWSLTHTDPAHELSNCPLLTDGSKRGDHHLYREFLKGSWLMPPLPAPLISKAHPATFGANGTRAAPTSAPSDSSDVTNNNSHWGGLSMALIRLDRLVGRILVQVTDNLAPKSLGPGSTPNPVVATQVGTRIVAGEMKPTSGSNAPTTAPGLTTKSATAKVPLPSSRTLVPPVTTPTLAPPAAETTPTPPQANCNSSPAPAHPPAIYSAQTPRKSSALIPKRGGKADQNLLQCPKSRLSAQSLSPLSFERPDDASDGMESFPKWMSNGYGVPGLRANATRRVASYAEIVKRRSWCGSNLTPRMYYNVLNRSVDTRFCERRTPVSWEICSPAPSVSPYARTPSSSSSSPSLSTSTHSSVGGQSLDSSPDRSNTSTALSSNRSGKSSSLSPPPSSQSPHISSSNSSIPSILRPRCAVAASPTSVESCASLLSVDLCNRSSLARPPQPASTTESPQRSPPLSSSPVTNSQPPVTDAAPSPSKHGPSLTSSASLPTDFQLPGSTNPQKTTASRVIPVSNLRLKPKDLGTELGLPTLVPIWLFLAQVPFEVTQEAVSMKLEQYEERVHGNAIPNQVSLNHLVDELRELLSTTLQITVTYRKRLITALKLDTVAQLRRPLGGLSVSRRGGTRSAFGCVHSDSDSDVPGLKDSCFPGDAVVTSSRPGPPGRWPDWFRRATHEVRAFLDDSPSSPVGANLTVGHGRTWPVSVPALLTVYVDCFIRLIDAQTWVGEGDPSALRSRVENEWNFLRRLYRQLYRCRGGLQYFSMRNASLAVRILPPTAEAAFIRACQRLLESISKQLCPAISDWVSSSLAMRASRASGRPENGFLDATMTADTENGKKNNCTTDSLSPSPNESFEWASPPSSVLSVPPTGSGPNGGGNYLRTEFFQEYNETWRELLVLNFYVPNKCSSRTGSVLSSRYVYDGLTCVSPTPIDSPPVQTHGGGFVGQLSVDSEPSDTRIRAYARFARELRRTGHVLLHSWEQPKVDGFDRMLKLIPAPVVFSYGVPCCSPTTFTRMSIDPAVNLWKFSADSTSGDPIDRLNLLEERSLVIVSPEERRAVRFHVSELVHRILRQLIFKFRKHTASGTPYRLPSIWQTKKPRPDIAQTQPNPQNISERANQFSNPRNRIPLSGLNENRVPPSQLSSPNLIAAQTGSHMANAFQTSSSTPIAAANQKTTTSSAQNSANDPVKQENGNSTNKRNSQIAKSQAEYLLICPEFPERIWDGLVYRFSRRSHDDPAESRSAYSRRLRYALGWLALMSTRGTLAPLFTASVELSNLITCHLLAERPYSAWTALCESSSRIRRWLSLGLMQMKSTGFDRVNNPDTGSMQGNPLQGIDFGAAERGTDLTSPTNACILHLAPIHPDLGAACAQLHKSLCDLSARLHASLLVMDSHLRELCDTHAEECDRMCVTRNTTSERHQDSRRLRSISPRRSASRELTVHALSGDTLQRAYSTVFGFHKTLMRLMATAPLTNILQNDESLGGGLSEQSLASVPIQTSLANLGVQLLASWSHFVTRRYHRGRGRIPRWANDACHFAYQLCQPRSVTFLEARKVAALEATLNDLIPYLVGEEKHLDSNSLSPVPSRLSPISVHESIDKPLYDRCHSAVASAQFLRGSHSLRRTHRRVHSMHSDRRSNRGVSTTSRPSALLTSSVGKRGGGSLDSERVTGEVYQAFNLQTHEMMAVKEVRFDHDTFTDAEGPLVNGSDSPRQRTAMLRHHRETQARLNAFRRECDLLSSLSHPAVVRFLGADEQTPKVLRLFTELYTAGTLADVVRDRLPEALVRRYAHDLARAVAYLHDRGIVHRDIKPANIFLVGSPYVGPSSQQNASAGQQVSTNNPSANGPVPEYSLLKLGDFSHALRLHSLSHPARDGEIREVAGTVCYMAPEVCQSQSRGLVTGYGRPCDIWSYCCVVLALVTGRQPWHQYRDSLAIFYRLCQNQTPPLPQVCPATTKGHGCVERRSLVPTRSTPSSSDDGLPFASAEAVALLQAGIQPDPSRRPTAAGLFQFDFVNCPVTYLSHVELTHSR